MTPARPVDLARLALGGWALARPDDLLHLVGDGGPGPRTITRLLGGRYVVQSGAGVALPRRPPHWLDAAVDLAHAASMLGAARAVPRHRRSALASAVLAVTFAVADLREQGRVR
jgi:hypothetical protein